MTYEKRISVRLDQELFQLLKRVCKIRRESKSSFVRKGIMDGLAKLSYLTPDEMKALGFNGSDDDT